MAIDVVKAPSWRIGVEDAARVAPLRDYFRRLGLDPEDRGPLAFDVETSMPAGELEESIACWVNVNAIPVQLLPVKDEPASQPDALQPLLLPPPRIGELLVRKGSDPGALSAVREHLPKITVAVAELSAIKIALRSIVGSGAR